MSAAASVAAVVLAAGGSARLGRPKQLVPIEGEPLVRRAARAALDAGCRPVLVVLGSEPEAVRAALADLPVLHATNPLWTEGVGGSIACGVRALAPRRPAGCIVLPCDQPRLTARLLATLIERARNGDPAAVACRYGGTIGTPVLFTPALFDRLSALTGDSGARRVLRACSPLEVVDFPGGELDIDTDADLRSATAPGTG